MQTEKWSVPVNVAVAKLVKPGKLPVSLQAGAGYWAEAPDTGPEGSAPGLVLSETLGSLKETILDEEGLKLSDRLAIRRTLLAEDRSILAWVRTSLSLIGFGFSIYKFLEYLMKETPSLPLRPHSPRNIGLFLILTGSIPLLFAMFQYRQALKAMGRKGKGLLTPGFLAASVIFLFGTLLALSIILSIAFL
jgi:putative membrane protein